MLISSRRRLCLPDGRALLRRFEPHRTPNSLRVRYQILTKGLRRPGLPPGTMASLMRLEPGRSGPALNRLATLCTPVPLPANADPSVPQQWGKTSRLDYGSGITGTQGRGRAALPDSSSRILCRDGGSVSAFRGNRGVPATGWGFRLFPGAVALPVRPATPSCRSRRDGKGRG